MPDPTPAAPTDAAIAFAWHDVTCPEARDCRGRWAHALARPVVTSGVLHRFMAALAAPATGVLLLDPQPPVALGSRTDGYRAVLQVVAAARPADEAIELAWATVHAFADATIGPDPELAAQAAVVDDGPAGVGERS